jgi:hypothetical protein
MTIDGALEDGSGDEFRHRSSDDDADDRRTVRGHRCPDSRGSTDETVSAAVSPTSQVNPMLLRRLSNRSQPWLRPLWWRNRAISRLRPQLQFIHGLRDMQQTSEAFGRSVPSDINNLFAIIHPASTITCHLVNGTIQNGLRTDA